MVDDLIAEFIGIRAARNLARGRVVTEREMELWIEHVGPDGKLATRDNLKRFWTAMVAKGLQKREYQECGRVLEVVAGD